jgi:CcmD family protein
MNKLIYIMAANLIIWIGVYVIVFRIDRKVKKLEEKCQNGS